MVTNFVCHNYSNEKIHSNLNEYQNLSRFIWRDNINSINIILATCNLHSL